MADKKLPIGNPLENLAGKGEKPGGIPPSPTGNGETPAASFSFKDILRFFKEVNEGRELFSIFTSLYGSKIPAQFRGKISYIIAAVYIVLYGFPIFFPLFLPTVYEETWLPMVEGLPEQVVKIANPIIFFLQILPVFVLLGGWLWRRQREKNFAEIQKAFTEKKVTVILKPRGDDKNKWRDTYSGFWQVIHRQFRVADKDVLLQKTPYASFEILRYGPWLTKNKRPDFAIAVTMDKEKIQSVLTQLQALHNDMVMDYPEEPLIAGISNEDNAQIIWQDYTPAGSAASMMQTDTAMDSFRLLATTIRDISTGVYSAGVQVLVRDALNLYAEISEQAQQMQYTPDQKRKPLDEQGKAMVRELEQKKLYSSNDINYDIVIRIYAVGQDENQIKMTLLGMTEWIRQISGKNSLVKVGEGTDFETVEERRYPSKHKYLSSISPIELANIWHIPDVQDNISILSRASFRMVPPPQNAIIQAHEKARLIGYYPTANGVKLPIGIRQTGRNPDIFFHTYVVGPTGVGKSVCLQNMIVCDMNAIHEPTGRPFSVIVLEPHEDLTKDILIRVPDNREGDVILIDPLDPWPFGLNMMETSGKPEDVEVDAGRVMGIFAKAMGSTWDSAVRMKRMMGNAVQTIMRVVPARKEIPTILHLQAFLTNPTYRQYIIEGLTADDGMLMNEWMTFLSKSEGEQANILDPAVTRINTFLNNQILRRIIAQPKNSLDFGKLMDAGTIILAKMNNRMGESNRALLGSLIVNAVFKSAMARGEIDIQLRQPTGFYIDEFASFVNGTGKDIEAILAEARKFRLGLTLVSQFFNQLPPDVQSAVGNNTGSKVVFRCEPEDARLFEKYFLGKLTASDFTGLQRYMAHLKIMSKENPEIVTVYTYPNPPIPESAKLEPITKDVDEETARILGITLTENRPKVFTNAEQLLGFCMKLNPRDMDDPEVHKRLVTACGEVSDEIFRDYQTLRKKWGEAQRKIILKEPGYIPDKKKRIEQLSRLRVGVPAFEIDALLTRLNNQIQRIMNERAEAAGEDEMGGDDDFFSFGGGSKSSKGGKGGKGGGKSSPAKGKKKGGDFDDDDLASFFDAF